MTEIHPRASLNTRSHHLRCAACADETRTSVTRTRSVKIVLPEATQFGDSGVRATLDTRGRKLGSVAPRNRPGGAR